MTTRINHRMTLSEWTMLLGLSVLWGGSFLFVGIAVHDVPTLTIVVTRVGLAALVLWAVVLATGTPLPRGRGVWGAFAVMGLLNNAVPFTLFVWGQAHLASGLASILNATTPLFTVLVAHVLTSDERLTPARLAGVAAGLAGVIVIVGPANPFGGDSMALAALACLGGALSYACAGIYGRRLGAMGVAPLVTAAGQVSASTLLLAPAMLVLDAPWTLPMPAAATLLALVGLAVLSTALAYLLYFRLLASAGATNLLLVTFLIPISAVLFGVFLLGEQLEPKHLAGMALVGLGLAAIDGRLLQRKRQHSIRPPAQ